MTESSEDLIVRCRELGRVFASRAAAYDREGRFPVEDFQDLRDAGLMGIMVPKESGGLGADFPTYIRAIEQIAIGGAATALTFNMHNIAVGTLAELDLSDVPGRRGRIMNDFRDWVFREAVEHGRVFASATTEPGIGAHFSKLTTSYRRAEGGFVLNGVKSFVSMAGFADYYVVAARSEELQGDMPSISFLVVDRDNPGARVEEVWDTLGMRATVSNNVYLKDCFVPADRLFLGSEGMVLYKITREPHWLVGGFTGVYLGICSATFEFLVEYLAKKKLPGSERTASEDTRIQHQVGELYTSVEAARAVVHQAARLVARSPGSRDANLAIHRAKYMVSELAPHLASQAIRLCGGSAIAKRLPLERFYRDARCGGLMPATSDECLLYVGKAALGGDVSKPEETYW